MKPQQPAFGTLRLARLSDLKRIGVVAAAGFYHSPFFAYMRPNYASFPEDTLSSYRSLYQMRILHPQYVVLVAEDMLDYDEPSFESQIPEGNLQNGKAIVAVVSLKLQDNSYYCGKFQSEGPNPQIPHDELHERDQSKTATELIEKAFEQPESTVFQGRQVIDTIVVHPAYWRHGHGSDLTHWITNLATSEGVGAAVMGMKMGKLLNTMVGFEKVETIEIPGYKQHPDRIYGWVGIFNHSSIKQPEYSQDK